MIKNNLKTNQGLIKWIVIIIIALLILGYYGVDVRKIILYTWNTYLKSIVAYVLAVLVKVFHR